MAPAFGLIRRLLGRGPISRDELKHTDFEAAVDVCSEDELDRSGRLVVRLSDPQLMCSSSELADRCSRSRIAVRTLEPCSTAGTSTGGLSRAPRTAAASTSPADAARPVRADRAKHW